MDSKLILFLFCKIEFIAAQVAILRGRGKVTVLCCHYVDNFSESVFNIVTQKRFFS